MVPEQAAKGHMKRAWLLDFFCEIFNYKALKECKPLPRLVFNRE